jgi:hypothetical protein
MGYISFTLDGPKRFTVSAKPDVFVSSGTSLVISKLAEDIIIGSSAMKNKKGRSFHRQTGHFNRLELATHPVWFNGCGRRLYVLLHNCGPLHPPFRIRATANVARSTLARYLNSRTQLEYTSMLAQLFRERKPFLLPISGIWSALRAISGLTI